MLYQFARSACLMMACTNPSRDFAQRFSLYKIGIGSSRATAFRACSLRVVLVFWTDCRIHLSADAHNNVRESFNIRK